MADPLQETLERMEKRSPSPSLVNPQGSDPRFAYFDLGEEIDPKRKVEKVPQFWSRYDSKADKAKDQHAALYNREDIRGMYEEVLSFVRQQIDTLADYAKAASSEFGQALQQVCDLSFKAGIPLYQEEMDHLVRTYNAHLKQRAAEEVNRTLDATWHLAEKGNDYVALQEGLEKVCKIAKACGVEFDHSEISDRITEFKNSCPTSEIIKVRQATQNAWTHAMKGSTLTTGALSYIRANAERYGIQIDMDDLAELIDTYVDAKSDSASEISPDYIETFPRPKTAEQLLAVEVKNPMIKQTPEFNKKQDLGAIANFYSQLESYKPIPKRTEVSGSRSFSHSF